ncbi:MAG: hypothetical protein GY934_13735 [Gammaproteobacteria bacterium]|nr:hypothetical protein [Gammaproteobacteria bacterium]
MFNWKAVLAGLVTMVVLGLLMQMLLIFTPVFYSRIVGDSILHTDYKDAVLYTVGILGFVLAAVSGGFMAAFVARKSVYLNAAIAGAGATGLSLILAGKFTLISLLFLTSGVLLALLGAYLWRRRT